MDKLFLKDVKANLYRGLKLVRMLNFDGSASMGPIRIDIAATSACNYKCCFCKSHSYLKANCVEPIFMSDEIIRNLFNDLRELHVKELLFSGNGEQLLSKALITEIKRNGKNFKIEVLSNGSTLSSVDEELFNNLNFLTISLNSGNGASHQITHGYKGENKFGEIVEHIERILNFANANNKIKLNYVITADNYDEIEHFFQRATKWDVSFMARPVSVAFQELGIKGLNHLMLDSLTKKIAQYLANKTFSSKLILSFQLVDRACQIAFRKLEGNNLYPCYVGFIQGAIESNGDVLLCCDGQEKPLGNLNKESFLRIWQKKENVALRIIATQMHKTNKSIFDRCVNCDNVQYHSLAFHNIYSKIPALHKLLENQNRKLNSLNLN